MGVASAQSVYYPVNTDDLDLAVKQVWCSNQISACTLLCLDQMSGGGFTNDCDPETLAYTCICADNTVPNTTEYSQTIPYFLCSYQVENCIQNCGIGAPNCAQKCKTDKVCGASNPTRVTSTKGSATTTKKPTGTTAPGDDEAFDDAEPTSDAQTSATDDDAPAETGSESEPSKTAKPNAGNRLSSATGGAFGLSVMMLSFICGALIFQL